MTPPTSPRRESLAGEIAALHPSLVALSHDLHAHPELSGEERRSVEQLVEALAAEGFEVEVGVAGLETAFIARKPLGGDGPRVAFLAEYDALPGVGHACGHCWIAASSLGAALALARAAADLSGEVWLAGTPAEETFGGKIVMADAGLFDDVDAALMVHPSRRTLVDRTSLASQPLELAFSGRTAHAASSPEDGRNALDALTLTSIAVDMLARRLRDDVRLPRVIVDGGDAPNLIPARAVARYSLRAADRAYLNLVRAHVERCARGAALATETDVEIREYEPGFDELRSSPVLVELFRAELARLGVEEDRESTGRGGSLDLGNLSQRIPALHPDLRVAPPDVSVHTPAFAEAAVSDLADARLATAAEALAGVGLALLEQRSLVDAAKRELHARRP